MGCRREEEEEEEANSTQIRDCLSKVTAKEEDEDAWMLDFSKKKKLLEALFLICRLTPTLWL